MRAKFLLQDRKASSALLLFYAPLVVSLRFYCFLLDILSPAFFYFFLILQRTARRHILFYLFKPFFYLFFWLKNVKKKGKGRLEKKKKGIKNLSIVL